MGRFSDSVTIFRTATRMIREDHALLAVPAIAAGAILGAVVLLFSPLLVVFWTDPGSLGWLTGSNGGYAVLLVWFIGAYVLLVLLGSFFASALIGMAMMKLEGGQPTVRDGIAFARQRIRRIVVWSLIAATVGLVIRAISQRIGGIAGLLVGALGEATWSIATYFILPVILFENQGPWSSLKRSGSLFINNFGRTVLANLIVVAVAIGLGALGVLLLVVGGIGLFGPGFLPLAAAVALLVVGLAIVVFDGVLTATYEGILQTALYRYPTTGKLAADLVPPQYQNPPNATLPSSASVP